METTPTIRDQPNREQRSMSARYPWRRFALRLCVSTLVALGFAIPVLRAFDLYYVTSYSMADTLLPGDLVVVGRRASPDVGCSADGQSCRVPQRGEIWVFTPSSGSGNAKVKRVIGLPGDTVAAVGGKITVNRASLPELDVGSASNAIGLIASLEWQRQYLLPNVKDRNYQPTLTDWGPLLVPPASYFVLGDNPKSSIDSRHEGFVSGDRMVGRVGWILFSYGLSDTAFVAVDNSVRWRRIGRTE